MKINIIGRKVNLRNNFKELAEKKLAKFNRIFDEDAEAVVTVTVERNRQTVEITIRQRGAIFRAENTAMDMNEALDHCVSALGRQIYCCGGNPEAARLSGIPSKNVLTFVYALSGFMAGLAGVVSVGRLASANANAGTTYDNDAIAACIVGGASFTGGKGTIWGTLIGAMIMAVIRNGLNLMGASNDLQYIVIGAVIILAVTIDVVRNKMEANARKMAAQ